MSGPFGSSQFMYATGALAEGSSLRFEDGDNPYLQWTPSTNGSSLTQTLSFWIKRTTAGNYIFRASEFYLYLDGNNLNYYDWRQGANGLILKTNAVYRDVSAWMHVVLTQDRGNATASNRIKMYVNGEQVTSFSTATYPNQNEGSYFNNSGNTHYISHPSNNQYDGYLANVTFIDGTALDPTSFGEYEDTLWKPKSDTDIQALTFGTNGFYLPFKQTTEAEGFSTVTYTGNGGTQGIEGVGFEPDFVWIKERSATSDHGLFDSVRGVGKSLKSNTTASEQTQTDSLTSFDSNGFSLGDNTEAGPDINYTSGSNYVAWCWDAGTGSAVSNTDGSITSTVKANTTNGFSIVSYNSNASGQDTVGHGLTSTPEMIITKSRDGSTFSWSVFHKDISTDNTKYLRLNLANGTTSYSTIWGAALPTSSVFGITSGGAVEASDACIAYCFHSVSGYSKISSYSGTGASGNSITGLGFKPAFMLIKRTDVADSWMLFDNTRDPVNPAEKYLFAGASDSEATFSSVKVDFDSDGFTLQGNANSINNSSGTYIYMAFKDTRDATFFGDTSGNGNNWTPNALNNTDVVPDSPVTNFAVFNSLSGGNFYGTAGTYSQGNLHMRATNSVSSYIGADSTIAVSSGKWYWEIRAGSNGSSFYPGIGVRSVSGTARNDIVHYRTQTQAYINGTPSGQTLSTYTSGDVIGLGLDLDNDTLQFYKNGSANGSTYSLNSGYDWVSVTGNRYNSSTSANFGADSSFFGQETPQGNTDNNGQGDFYYAPPSGFLALTRNNLPTPTITAPDEYFNTVLYTGTGSIQSITGVNFQPDWIWWKGRNASSSHLLMNSVVGNTKYLYSNSTSAEQTDGTNVLTSFDSDGFTLPADTGGYANLSGRTYASWSWLAGGTAVSNTDGSITSSVSANTDAGFSIVTHLNGSGTRTAGHGLNSAPELIIEKKMDATGDWLVATTVIDGSYDFLRLNTTAAKADAAVAAPTATVYSPNVGGGADCLAYCFHSVESYSKIGSGTGTGTSSSNFIHTGFRPAFVMIKRTDSTDSWVIFDNERPSYNVTPNRLFPDLSNSESTSSSNQIDMVSNGFVARGTSATWNASGSSFIFIAFAEAPFRNANAR